MDFLANIMKSALTFFYNLTVSWGFANYGVAIILLTVVIKVAMYPLTVKQVKSMKGMQEMQPRMKALQEKYKGNKEKLSSEMAALYKETGVNPLAGCLPLLIQMPFLIAIFYALQGYEYLGDPTFLTMNLSKTPTGAALVILPALSAITTYVQQKQTTTEMTQQNKMMMIFMPLFIGYITTTFPVGLGLYWVIGNVIQIIQQWWMYRQPAAK